jgi:prepilin-type N-terminal cleavage/methylation domain-containing protein
MLKTFKARGFTLIELLVVIAIIGILSTLAVIYLGNSRSKARDARRMSDLRAIQSSIELYRNSNDDALPVITSGSNWSTDLNLALGSNITPIVIDPINTGVSVYTLCVTGTNYLLTAQLENNPPAETMSGSPDIYGPTDCIDSQPVSLQTVPKICGGMVFCLGRMNQN